MTGWAATTRLQKLALAVAAIACLLAVLIPRDGLFAQAVPDYRPLDTVVFVLAAVAAVAAAIALFPVERDRRPSGPIGPFGRLAIFGSASFVLLMIVLLIVSPRTLWVLVREDGPAEYLQAALLFLGALAAAVACLTPGPRQRSRVPYCALLAVLLALIGLEEVSWFQRILGIETPDWLAEMNAQGETNFHNVATHPSEYAYYLGTLSLFVFSRAALVLGSTTLERFIPSLSVFAIGTLSAGLNYEMWPNALAVLGFALAVAFATALTWTAVIRRQWGRAIWLTVIVVTTILAQIALMTMGDRLFRVWHADEVRETLIAGGLALYALQLALAAQRERLSLASAEA